MGNDLCKERDGKGQKRKGKKEKGWTKGVKEEQKQAIGGKEQAKEEKKRLVGDLFSAVRWGNTEKVRQLLQEGRVCVNDTDEEGTTALHEAAKITRQCIEVGKILLEWKADVNAKNTRKKTPLMEAVFAGNSIFAKFLLENGACMGTPQYSCDPLLFKAIFRNTQLLRILLQHGASVNETNVANETAMTLAVKNSLFNSASVLIDHGADFYYRNVKDQSFLYTAVKHGQVDLVWMLMTSGANTEWDHFHPTVWELSKNNAQMRKALLHFWTPEDHFRHNKKIRDAIMSMLIIAKRLHWRFDTSTLHLLFSYIAYNFIPPLRCGLPTM